MVDRIIRGLHFSYLLLIPRLERTCICTVITNSGWGVYMIFGFVDTFLVNLDFWMGHLGNSWLGWFLWAYSKTPYQRRGSYPPLLSIRSHISFLSSGVNPYHNLGKRGYLSFVVSTLNVPPF